MKKNLLLIVFIVFVFGLNAQKQLENPGFENWEPIAFGPVPEPVNWNSVRTAIPENLAKLAPAVWDSSGDAHSGNYSVYLVNISTFSIVATGSLTSGRLFASVQPEKGFTFTDIHDPEFNMPLTHRPDSITGWYKCNPQPGDFPTLKMVLHSDSANFPTTDSSNWIGYAFYPLSITAVETWTRFSFPIHYLKEGNPEYVLLMLTAGNGTSAIAGSEAWFDDLELIYNGTGVDELTASDFNVYVNHKNLTVYIDDNRNSPVRLQMLDMTGRQVFVANMITGKQHRFHIDVPTGIYVVVATVERKMLTQKIFIK